MKTNQIISSNGNTITLKLNEFNGLMGPFLQDDNLPSSFSPSLSSTIFETASFSALDVNNLTNIESSIATTQETPVIVAKTSGLSEDLSKNLYLSEVHNSSKSSTTNSLDTIAINEFTQLIGPIPPDDYIKSSGLTLSSISSGVGVNGVGTEVYKIDDGTAENSIGLNNPSDFMWLNQFTVAPGFQTITSIALAWGLVPTGLPTKLLVYEDPNDDGNPNDAVLLRSVDTTVANPNTSQFKTVTITPTTVSGSFFIAALLPNQQAQQFPAPIDQTAPKSNRSWLVAGQPGQFNINNLTANTSFSLRTIEEAGLPGNWLLRADSQGQPQTGSISGMKWNDLNGNRLKDAGEPGLANWQIYIDSNRNGQRDTGEPTQTTNAQGNYTFSNLQAGTYVIAEVQQAGWQQTFPGTGGGSTSLIEPFIPFDPSIEKPSISPKDFEPFDPNNFDFTLNQSYLEEKLGFEFLDRPLEIASDLILIATGPSPDEIRPFGHDNVNAADTTNADQLRSGGGLGLNLSGNGITVGVWDGGKVRNTHQEFGSRVSFGDSATSFGDHGTHVAGTIGATGVNANARGMANQVQIRSFDWDNDYNEIQSNTSLIDLSNHSYGQKPGWNVFQGNDGTFYDFWFADRNKYDVEDPYFGKYDAGPNPITLIEPKIVGADARGLDQLLYNNPNYLSIWSAGNERGGKFFNAHQDQTYITYLSTGVSQPGWYILPTNALPAPPGDGNGGTGYDTIAGNKTAKNSLVVGAIDDITADPYTKAQVKMSDFSSWGPTDDGRIKPDVVGNGVDLFSPVATSNTSYDIYSGTSMASPNVTGTTALLYEHWKNLYSGKPRSATMKGVLIHTAFDAGNTGPDYVYGWGVVDGAAAAKFLTDTKNTSSAHLFKEQTYNGTEWTLPVTSNGSGFLKATIAWTDPAGTAHPNGLDITTPVLVNNLDLWITGPGGTYRPWTLNPANPSAAAVRTSANNRDNVEQVLIDTPTAGNYTIHVGRTGNSFTQNFSLLVSGVGSSTPPLSGTHTVNLGSGQNVTGKDFGNKQTTPATLAIAATNANQPEGNIGTKAFTFTVTRSGTTTSANNVNWAVTGSGTNPANATDFAGGILQSGIVNFAAGDTTPKVITVNVQGDTTVEQNENFTVTLSNPTNGATITTATALGTIQNDDGVTLPTITLASNYSGVSENGKANLVYTFNRTGATTSPLTVNFGVGGTATRNSDYAAYGGNFPTATTGNVTFAAGATTAQLVVVTSGDTVKEVNETIALTLASGTGYQIGTIPTVTTTILNDDGVLNQKGTTGNDVLEAGSTPILSGKAGNDILIGSRTSDILVGGTGNDTLTTGTGFDTVLFSSKTEGIDVITDFNVTEDIFQVSAAAFGGGLVAGESISAAQFSLSLASVSTTTRFIFDKPTGKLFFDLDGNGATAAIQIASLTANLNLTQDNIFVA